MIQELQLRVVPEVAGEYELLKTFVSKTFKNRNTRNLAYRNFEPFH
ncbi:hypothetical protein LEP1GSC115_1531 [Leptospira interrogans serovar Australis str. 200703203]|uniref:Uncharacterized protein n=1 Tax=Leptospira interrogans serovar Australis str. 200703203 TaxID=1085541 RepID=N1UQ05_LEPIR|nr:hypothetical protein LEP1GSC115_1531 [Leptospira interrogans serovar Australis str. 200703203]